MDVAPFHQENPEELNARAVHRVILRVLHVRFGHVPKDVCDVVRVTTGEAGLDALMHQACACPDLAEFRARLGL